MKQSVQAQKVRVCLWTDRCGRNRVIAVAAFGIALVSDGVWTPAVIAIAD